MRNTVPEVRVNTHPGVMSHVAGLFSRRAFTIAGILCGPVGDGRQGRGFLLVAGDRRLGQVPSRIGKLRDVLEVRGRGDYDQAVFTSLGQFVVEKGDHAGA